MSLRWLNMRFLRFYVDQYRYFESHRINWHERRILLLTEGMRFRLLWHEVSVSQNSLLRDDTRRRFCERRVSSVNFLMLLHEEIGARHVYSLCPPTVRSGTRCSEIFTYSTAWKRRVRILRRQLYSVQSTEIHISDLSDTQRKNKSMSGLRE